MNHVRVNRVTAAAGPEDAARSARITRRAVEILGRQLALGDAIAPLPKLMLDVTMPPGMSEEQMAQRIARELALKLA
jgi:hypothetical protein